MSKEITDYVSDTHVSKNSEGFLKKLTDNKYVAKAALYATLAAGAMGLYAGNYTANNARAEVVTVNA
ncbi:MAG: hypothetical protein Q7S56_02680, partial [Nanoarchaeota archaeon]|nr:hypothetical protein [Nanoarchaeota archaeon]